MIGTPMVQSSHYAFVSEYANPFMWLQTAEFLHESAKDCYEGKSDSIITRIDNHGIIVDRWGTSQKPAALLAGFALENAIKAFLVFENPNWVSNGKLSKTLKSHDLVNLKQRCKYIPYRNTRDNCLRYFSEGLEGWARYPCGLDNESTKRFKSTAFSTMWGWYLEIMQAYGRALNRKLRSGWNGPHGFHCQWKTSGKSEFEI